MPHKAASLPFQDTSLVFSLVLSSVYQWMTHKAAPPFSRRELGHCDTPFGSRPSFGCRAHPLCKPLQRRCTSPRPWTPSTIIAPRIAPRPTLSRLVRHRPHAQHRHRRHCSRFLHPKQTLERVFDCNGALHAVSTRGTRVSHAPAPGVQA